MSSNSPSAANTRPGTPGGFIVYVVVVICIAALFLLGILVRFCLHKAIPRPESAAQASSPAIVSLCPACPDTPLQCRFNAVLDLAVACADAQGFGARVRSKNSYQPRRVGPPLFLLTQSSAWVGSGTYSAMPCCRSIGLAVHQTPKR